MKGDSGVVDLTESPAALQCLMISGPEMACMIGEFEVFSEKKKKTDIQCHEQTKHTQMVLTQDVKALTSTKEDMGSPFCEESSDLLMLDSRNTGKAAVINTVCKTEKLGRPV